MAEYGAHHATSRGSTPSIFEVIGQENLIHGLRNAFRHIFKVLGENYPDRYGLLYRHFDEGYTVVDSVFQYIHLRLKGGLLPETFYGLKRLPDPRSLDVSKRKVAVWVFLSIVFPYLQAKMENLYKKKLDEEYQKLLSGKDFKTKMALLYVRLYPYYNLMWELILMCYYMAYALKKSKFHSPLMHLTSTTLTHLTFVDASEDAWRQSIPQHELRTLSALLWNYMNIFVSGVTFTISVGAFFSQFLNWWYSREGGRMSFTSNPIPPPPLKWPFDSSVNLCPLCKRKRTNDTALACSGFVFCYTCIYKFVDEKKRCPITGYKASTNHLVKLYHQ